MCPQGPLDNDTLSPLFRRALGLAMGLLVTTMLLIATGAKAQSVGDARSAGSGGGFQDMLRLEPTGGVIWHRLRERFQWQDDVRHPRVQEWIARYLASPRNIVEITKRARPWLHWIVSRLEARDLPGEIALLPFVESGFDPAARSSHGALGLWQFMPLTGDELGLVRGRGYDGRLDVVASTRAALDYLEGQAERWYAGDLTLSLAAYNAGAGTVNRARRAAARRGEPTDYWHLRLPRETMDYVPKLLAISAIVADPERHGVELPAIRNAPAFATVEIDTPLSLAQAAELAEVSRGELEALNPGLLGDRIHPAHTTRLLVPIDKVEPLVAGLELIRPATVGSGTWYVVRRGDSLSVIADRYDVSLAEIRRHNALDGDLIRAGQTLRIPRQPMPTSSS